MSKFCTNCGYEVQDEASKFCANCGANVSHIKEAQEENEPTANAESQPKANSKEESFASEELIRIPCAGRTTLQHRLLIIYNDHIALFDTDNDIMAFDEHYDNIAWARGSKSKIFSNKFYLDLKNGEILKFSLDVYHDLNGNYYSKPALNTDVNQLIKTLPAYINKLITAYKTR